jgi:dienelactone hydrolase
MRISTGALIVVVGIAFAQSPVAQEIVKFPTLGVAGPSSLQITGHLYRPKTGGKVPAVVILHGCGGQISVDWQWGEWLSANGYAALAVDSFSPRNRQAICAQPVGHAEYRVQDAFGAALWLQQLPFVDRNRIGVMGFSHGGGIALALGFEEIRRFTTPSAPRFRVSVPLYPGGCGVALSALGRELDAARLRVPTLILHGAKDDWTPAAPCQAWVARARAKGDPISIVVYPDAHHSFDQVERPLTQRPFLRADGSGLRGVTVGGNRAARDAARRDLLAFLKKSL